MRRSILKAIIQNMTIDVDDLKRTFAFLRDGLGLLDENAPEPRADSDEFTLPLAAGNFMLRRPNLWKLTDIGYTLDPTRSCSTCLLSRSTTSREDVVRILENAKGAGGTIVAAASDLPWGFAGYVLCPDGNLWEIIWAPRS
jgi:uncharacterized protein